MSEQQPVTVTTVDVGRMAKAGFGVLLAMGILTVVLGAILLFWPTATIKVVAVLFGIWLFVSGIFQLVQAFSAQQEGTSRTLMAISGVLSILLGAICFTSVAASVTILVIFVILGWLMRGIVYLIAGLQDKDNPGRGSLIVFGILLLLLAILVIAWPQATLTVLVRVLGIGLVLTGAVEVIAALMSRKSLPEGQVTVIEQG